MTKVGWAEMATARPASEVSTTGRHRTGGRGRSLVQVGIDDEDLAEGAVTGRDGGVP
ncbi:hypothetical protein [Nonomuraea insulae]|uniref:Uncharacterized protein n=1 Tax=Nonomuraea insulae TaxID=1616787 RepID=A0ABW1CHI1_9ACTN